ncbi:MAG TPA: hypothetical protein VGZ22_24260 [Isosphaeraceae bacterium]|jgi:hypothetical protein|nr:hypothetical protein [Isosphaeraceae bacterium]
MGSDPNIVSWLRRPLGRGLSLLLKVFICAVPAWLFYDLLIDYRLHSDDFAYVAASRTFGRTMANLFVPHNTHIVPAWRLLTWMLCALAGKLANLQLVFAVAAYGALVLVMLLVGAFVARETGRAVVGLAATAGAGTTWLMASAATWYSAGQTMWAGLGILVMLWFLQGWRRQGGTWRLVLAALATWFAAGFWSIGHAAGPVGAVYLWTDGRPQCRKMAWVPLAATLAAVAIAMALGGRQINATISFGGRTTLQAADPVQGVLHTLQAIPEYLVFGNLGLLTETTPGQGAVLTLVLAVAWLWTVRRRGRLNPLEAAGAALVVISSLVEWTVRGYLPFTSLRGLVPWYQTIPHIGFILLLAGWCSGQTVAKAPGQAMAPLTRGGAIALILLQAALFVLHEPRVEAEFQERVPGMSLEERKTLPIPSLQHLRAVYVASARTTWQNHALARLDRAEAVARQLGIGRKAIHETFGRLVVPEISDVYDAADMLALPWEGPETNLPRVRQALGPLIEPEPDPAPPNAILKELGIRIERDGTMRDQSPGVPPQRPGGSGP